MSERHDIVVHALLVTFEGSCQIGHRAGRASVDATKQIKPPRGQRRPHRLEVKKSQVCFLDLLAPLRAMPSVDKSLAHLINGAYMQLHRSAHTAPLTC